jgi:hypothetical protein
VTVPISSTGWALTDRAEALQDRVQQRFATFSLVLDFIHAAEKLWDAANSLYGETADQRTAWVEAQTLDLLSGRTPQVISELRQLATGPATTATQRTVLNQVANYFERNAAHMHYDQYLAQGWPIASGVIEGACRHLVKDRCELSGMRWTKDGVENLLRLRAVAENDDWAAYQRFHHQQRQQRLYGVSLPRQKALEDQALSCPAPLPQTPPTGRAFIMPVIVKQRSSQPEKWTA